MARLIESSSGYLEPVGVSPNLLRFYEVDSVLRLVRSRLRGIELEFQRGIQYRNYTIKATRARERFLPVHGTGPIGHSCQSWPTMSVAIDEAQERRRRYPERVPPTPLGASSLTRRSSSSDCERFSALRQSSGRPEPSRGTRCESEAGVTRAADVGPCQSG